MVRKLDISYDNTYHEPASQAENIDNWQQTERATRGQEYSRKEIKIPVLLVRPDRYQPRLQLPEIIGNEFYSGNIDCFEAARRWIDLSKSDLVYKQKMDKLIELGNSLDEYGQIKPITGSYQENPITGKKEFYLETGERRFWSVVIDAVSKGKSDDSVTIVARKESDFSPERQAEENEKVEPLSAVGRAREVSRLLLHSMGIAPDQTVDYGFCGYHRQIVNVRVPADKWEKVTKITGVGRKTLYKLINILKMDDSLLTIADGYSVPFRVLISISEAPKKEQQLKLQEWVSANKDEANDNGITSEGNSNVGSQVADKSVNTKGFEIPQATKLAKKMRLLIIPNYKKLEKEVENPISILSDELYRELRDVEEINLAISRLHAIADKINERMKQDNQKV